MAEESEGLKREDVGDQPIAREQLERRVGAGEFSKLLNSRLDRYGNQFSGENPMDTRGRGDIQREFAFPVQRKGEPPPDDQIHVQELSDPFSRGEVLLITDDNTHKELLYDPITGTGEERVLGDDGDYIGEPVQVGNFADWQRRILDLQPQNRISSRVAEKIGAKRIAAQLRGENVPPLDRGQRIRRGLAAAAAVAVVAGGPTVINEVTSDTPPTGPGIGAPERPGQEQEAQQEEMTREEIQKATIEAAQSIIDNLKNPNLGFVQTDDGTGIYNDRAYYSPDGQQPNFDNGFPDGAHHINARIVTNRAGSKILIIEEETRNESTGAVNDLTLVFDTALNVDTDESGKIDPDEIDSLLGAQGTEFRAGSYKSGATEADGKTVTSGDHTVLGLDQDYKVRILSNLQKEGSLFDPEEASLDVLGGLPEYRYAPFQDATPATADTSIQSLHNLTNGFQDISKFPHASGGLG